MMQLRVIPLDPPLRKGEIDPPFIKGGRGD